MRDGELDAEYRIRDAEYCILDVAVWDLEFFWNLELGIWNFISVHIPPSAKNVTKCVACPANPNRLGLHESRAKVIAATTPAISSNNLRPIRKTRTIEAAL